MRCQIYGVLEYYLGTGFWKDEQFPHCHFDEARPSVERPAGLLSTQTLRHVAPSDHSQDTACGTVCTVVSKGSRRLCTGCVTWKQGSWSRIPTFIAQTPP